MSCRGIWTARVILLAGAGSLWADSSADREASTRPPNVVYVMADDLGYGELGSYGQRRIRTPHLDRMAEEGIRFTQFYSASTVCAPAREALLLGRHTGHVRRTNSASPLDSSAITIAEVLRARGYATAMIGKWSLGGGAQNEHPSAHGFDHWFGFLDQTRAHRHYPRYLWRNGEKIFFENHDSHGETYAPDVMMEEAHAFIRHHRRGPFFVYLALTLPHADIIVPQRFLREYLGRFPETPFQGSHYSSQPTPNAATAAMISLIDTYMGRLLGLLKELDLDRSTAVFFTSDNGPVSVGGRDFEFFEGAGPLRGHKRDLYEGGIRVPMIARWPGRFPSSTVSDQVWGAVDVLPTLAKMAGHPPLSGVDGVSVLPTLEGREQDLSNRPLYWAWEGRELRDAVGTASAWGEKVFAQAVRLGNWKGVRFNGTDSLELYDLASDIGEGNDVSKLHPKVVRRLLGIMEREQQEASP